jgi:hypothetical protein
MPKVSKVPIKAVIKISGNSSQTGYQKRKKIKKQDFFPKVKKYKFHSIENVVLHFVFRNTQTDCLFFQFQPNPREINSSAL